MNHKKFSDPEQVLHVIGLEPDGVPNILAVTTWVLDEVKKEKDLVPRTWEWLRTNYAVIINTHLDYVIPPWHMSLMLDKDERESIEVLAISSLIVTCCNICEGKWDSMTLKERTAVIDFILG